MQTLQHQPRARAEGLSRIVAINQPYTSQNAAIQTNARPASKAPKVFVVGDNARFGESNRGDLEAAGYAVSCFSDSPSFLKACQLDQNGCVLIDAQSSGTSAIALVAHLKRIGANLSAILLSDAPTVPMAVLAVKAGAFDVVRVGAGRNILIAAIKSALEHTAVQRQRCDGRQVASRRIASLTSRQHEILELVLAGHPSKNIAADLHISQRTVDNHRAAIARKTGTKTLSALIQTALCGGCTAADLVTRDAPIFVPAHPTSENAVH